MKFSYFQHNPKNPHSVLTYVGVVTNSSWTHAAAGAPFPVITLQPSTKLRNLSCGGCGKIEKTMVRVFKIYFNKIAPEYKDETYLCISKNKKF